MIARILMLMLGLLPMATTAEAGVWDKIKGLFFPTRVTEATIDVLIVDDQPSAMLELKGKYHIYDPNTKQHISTRFVGKKKPLQTLSSGLKWGEEFPGIYQLQIVPDHQGILSVVNGKEYRGSLFIYDIGGTISIVNRTNVEDYLSSILPTKYGDPMPEETCAAIAIAARTDACYLAQNMINPYWAVDAERVGYKGLLSMKPNSEMEHAIKATTHMVMSWTGTYEGQLTLFAPLWASMDGGHPAGGQAVISEISLQEADEMGRHGKHAAQILSKAFPNTHIELIQ